MDQPEAMPVTDEGRFLVERWAQLEKGEVDLFLALAHFDDLALWALDGFISAPGWMMWKMGMSRSTAFEKLRMGHELARRPVVADAMRHRGLGLCKARAITRMVNPAPEVDEAMVDYALAEGVSVVQVEQAVRTYQLYADQDRPPSDDPVLRRDLRVQRRRDGTARIIVDVTDTEAGEFLAALQAFIDLRRRPVDGSTRGDGPGEEAVAPASPDPVDESTRGDSTFPGSTSVSGDHPEPAPLDGAGRCGERVDAFMELTAAALHSAGGGRCAGDDRYMVHLVSRDGGRTVTTLDGEPVHPAAAATICCDSSTVDHHLARDGETLVLGRKTRVWSTAQRRAISVRDGGHCRCPGCPNRLCDIHHIRPWEAGGPTDVANGVELCRRHHRMLHAGYRLDGDPGSELRFHRPDGTYIGSTWPATQQAFDLATVTGTARCGL